MKKDISNKVLKSLSFSKNENEHDKKQIVAIKKSASHIVEKQNVSFYISQEKIVSKHDEFHDVRQAIYNLEIGKTLIVSNENTGLSMNELKRKITNIAFAHSRKHVQKKFITSKINNTTFTIYRDKDNIIN